MKALYRRGVANSSLGEFEDAKHDLKEAYNLDSTNTAVVDEYNAVL